MNPTTSTTSNPQLLPPPDFQEIFPAFNSDHSAPKHHQKPRKKRTKLIRINNSFAADSSTSIIKPKYTKKPDPTAPKITRPCSECGKKFWSWKALFGHMRCHPERQWRGINPPPNLNPHDSSQISNSNDFEDIMTEEDHQVARCLLMLANGPTIGHQQGLSDFDTFECTSCKKVFGSRQALGGHRASHKNVKGCFAITRNDGEEDDDRNERNYDEGEEDNNNNNNNNKMVMVLGHKCGICLKVFSSGQALGGHKRCHWDQKGDEPSSSLSTQVVSPFGAKVACGLDLNLPVPQDYYSSSSYSSGLALDLRLGL